MCDDATEQLLFPGKLLPIIARVQLFLIVPCCAFLSLAHEGLEEKGGGVLAHLEFVGQLTVKVGKPLLKALA